MQTNNKVKEGWDKEFDVIWSDLSDIVFKFGDDKARLYLKGSISFIVSQVIQQERERIWGEVEIKLKEMWNYPCLCDKNMVACGHNYNLMFSILCNTKDIIFKTDNMKYEI